MSKVIIEKKISFITVYLITGNNKLSHGHEKYIKINNMNILTSLHF